MRRFKITMDLEVLADSEADARARVLRAMTLIQHGGDNRDLFHGPDDPHDVAMLSFTDPTWPSTPPNLLVARPESP